MILSPVLFLMLKFLNPTIREAWEQVMALAAQSEET